MQHRPITERAELEDQLARIRPPGPVAIDTEFLREKTYYAQLCLVQVAYGEHAWCLDTLAPALGAGDAALAPLRPVLADAGVCKILHAARQDLEVLWPHVGVVRNVWDTQLAAALCGAPAQIGYAALVSDLLGVQLPKSETRTDWSRRPLSTAQVDYALDDVRYLLPAREALLERLERSGRLAWFDEDSLGAAGDAQFEVRADDAWRRFKGFEQLDEHRQRLAQTLAAWREQRAMKSDRPRGWLLPDAALREIVMRVPRSAADLGALRELPPGIRDNSGAQLLQIIAEARVPDPAPVLPQRSRPDPAALARVQKLLDVVRQAAATLRLAPELLATRAEVEALAAGDTSQRVLRGWRREVAGNLLLAAL